VWSSAGILPADKMSALRFPPKTEALRQLVLYGAKRSAPILYPIINDDFQNTDIALVIGANDVIKPAVRTVIIVKCSIGSGFAGEDNELFYDKKTMMLFGDAKGMVTDLLKAIKA
jgi:hypothetical protein